MADPHLHATVEAIELVSLNRARMQDLLTNVRAGDNAPAQLLAWGEVVDSAAQLWRALPQAPDVPTQTVLDRLQSMSTSLHTALAGVRWPSAHPDEHLITVADTYTRAADLLHHSPVSTKQADRIRTSVTASLHLGAHVVSDTSARYVAGAAVVSRTGAARHRRPNADLVADAAARLRGMEQITGAAVGGLYAPRPSDNSADADRSLASVLARWEVQSHRSLATRPGATTMMLIAQTEAKIGQFAAAVLHSRAALNDVDGVDLERRALVPLAAAVAGWRDTATEWRTMLVGDSPLHIDPLLAAASQQVRTVITDLTGGTRSRADPDLALAFRIDIPRASSAVQDALAHTADIARASRDLTLTPNLPFRGAARQLADRAVALAGDHVAWVDLRAIHRGDPVPLPHPVVKHLAGAYNDLATQAGRALSGSASLHTSTRSRIDHQPEPTLATRRAHRPPTTQPRNSPATAR